MCDDDFDDVDIARDEEAERIIRITGEIDEDSSEKFILLLHRVAKVPGDITVVISSDGGDIEEGLRIVDAMNIAKSKGCHIHTVVSGKAYSMAALITCIGDTRTMYSHSRMMFHPGRYEEAEDGKVLTPKELKLMYEELEMFNGMFKRILKNVGVSDTECDKMMSDDVYLNAEEAISLGIINSIETEII
jgi:ATP-dependent protease ClpP protease subunit